MDKSNLTSCVKETNNWFSVNYNLQVDSTCVGSDRIYSSILSDRFQDGSRTQVLSLSYGTVPLEMSLKATTKASAPGGGTPLLLDLKLAVGC